MSEDVVDELGVKLILRETTDVFKKSFFKFILVYLAWIVAIVIVVALAVFINADFFTNLENMSEIPSALTIGLLFLFIMAMSTLFSGTIFAMIWSIINKNPAPIRAGFARCIEVFLPLFGATLLVYLILFVVAAITILPGVYILELVAGGAGVLSSVGFFVLLLPTVVTALALILVYPIIIVENPGVVASIKRSVEMTKGHKRTILYFILLMLAGIFLAVGLIIALVGLGAISAGASQILIQPFQLVAGIFMTIMPVVVYKNLASQQKS